MGKMVYESIIGLLVNLELQLPKFSDTTGFGLLVNLELPPSKFSNAISGGQQ